MTDWTKTRPIPDGETACSRCGGRGWVAWGAIVNGNPTHTGTCFRCGGKGWQDEADKRRNYGYDNYAISRAFGR